MTTRIAVERTAGRHTARVTHGLLRAQILVADADRCRIGLIATTALLLGGDEVELEVDVGPGARLDLFDVAGTVAYHGRGEPSAWRVRIALAEDAALSYAGEPFVVADGADVTRSLGVYLAPGAAAVLRDTVVLGRAEQVGGRLRSVTAVGVGGRTVLLEDQVLDPAGLRNAPGLLGAHRVIDTVAWLGVAVPVPTEDTTRATTYALSGAGGTLARWLGSSLASSPLHRSDLTTRRAVPSASGPAAQSTASSR